MWHICGILLEKPRDNSSTMPQAKWNQRLHVSLADPDKPGTMREIKKLGQRDTRPNAIAHNN